jgi:hypothetical protein
VVVAEVREGVTGIAVSILDCTESNRVFINRSQPKENIPQIKRDLSTDVISDLPEAFRSDQARVLTNVKNLLFWINQTMKAP